MSPHAERFVLKGALMFTVWNAPFGRQTRDADFLGHGDNSIQALVRIVRDTCDCQVMPDGLRFDAATVIGERIRKDRAYEGVRVRLVGQLGQARIPMQLDIGFGDIVVPEPQLITYPTLLPGFPAAQVRGYTRESVVAEKFEAMVALGAINTRYKDFYDVWFLARHFDFDGATLAQAVEATFRRRSTPLPVQPTAWSDEFATDQARQQQWAAFLRRVGLVDAPARLSD